MALPVGAAILSLLVFLLLLTGAAFATSFLALGVCALLPQLWRTNRPQPSVKHEPVDRISALILTGIFSAYGVLYLIHALAPEIQPDALYYHLGQVAEYSRLGKFPAHIDFYAVLPQGMEMLYLFAFAFGEHPAAKLVHFAFLIATGPMILAVGRKLKIGDTLCWTAAALYGCAPVVGISGTSAYADAALVCCILATFYFLIAWREKAKPMYLAPAGLLAGFCYAIKINALLIPALALLFVLIECRRNPRQALARSGVLASASLIAIAPWMIRSLALTGNPLAPLFNAWFPNPYFLVVIERTLAHFMRTYQGFEFRNAPWELAVGGASHGILGPLFLALPVGLLALRRSAGRRVWLAAGLLAIPWFFNVGTRFLMPSLPFFALALAIALPRPVAWAALIFHAVTCWPTVIDRYERPGLWRLREFPWRAALRLQPDRDYLRSVLWDFRVAEMLNSNTAPGAKILGLTALSNAYIDREIIQYWQSALGVRLRETILEAAYTRNYQLYDFAARWTPCTLRAVRFRCQVWHPQEWEIHEASILIGEDRIPSGATWQTAAWPNLFEAPFAFDRNQATRWRTWEPARPGMFLEVDFGAPLRVDGATMSSHWAVSPIEVLGMTEDGNWSLLSANLKPEPRGQENLRLEAMRYLKRSGIDYIVTPVEGADGNVWLGKDLRDHAADYGIVEIAAYDVMRLYRP